MDDQAPTAWEEINPVLRRELSAPAAPSSALAARLESITDLTPVDRTEFYTEVAPCLTLAAGVGMSQADQRAWLEAAFIALKDIPIGLLRRGAVAALRTADHPSKIVPAIVAEVSDSWAWRREQFRSDPITPPKAEPEPEYCTPEQARAILEEFGLKSKFSSNRSDLA